MEQSVQDIESYLAVGLIAYLHPRTPGGGKTRIQTLVRGWQKGNYILLETPQREERLPIFMEDIPCTVRFLHDGHACGFETRVLESGRIGGFGYGRIAWPRHIETVRVRKQERIPTSIPCTLAGTDGKESKGVIEDLSSGGCCIRCDAAVSFKNGECLKTRFVLPDGAVVSDLPAVVRRVSPSGREIVLGCEFAADSDPQRQDINFYLATSMELARKGQADSRRALVIDGNRASATLLCVALQSFQLETFIATGLVDAFYRLRAINPLAVFIGHDQSEVPAPQLCRIVKSTKGFEQTLVFVYGSESMAVHDEALEAGADGYFSSVAKASNVRAILARFAPPPAPAK